jgi:ribosomal protein S18 acetylase RimI-like enzyme
MTVSVSVCEAVTPEIVDAIARLVPQLSRSAPAPTAEELEEIASSPASHLLVARVNGEIVGSLTLIVFRIPTGVRAWIEDVVVDEAARGHGVGEALNVEAVRLARDRGAITVDLTSRPSRDAANRLYQRLGFVQRDTNVYRYDITSSDRRSRPRCLVRVEPAGGAPATRRGERAVVRRRWLGGRPVPRDADSGARGPRDRGPAW